MVNRILKFIAVVLWIYLCTAFVESSIDFRQWSDASRFFTAVFGTMLGLFVAVVPNKGFEL